MAASKSWSSVSTAAPRFRQFTLAEANRSLPLIRRVVLDITKMHERATDLHGQLEERSNPVLRADIESEMERTVDRLQDLVIELKNIGCDIKDYRNGVVDFRSRHQGREICLCWMLGEETILHWHELHAGFNNRVPVTLLGADV
jgi:hypothetical protein